MFHLCSHEHEGSSLSQKSDSLFMSEQSVSNVQSLSCELSIQHLADGPKESSWTGGSNWHPCHVNVSFIFTICIILSDACKRIKALPMSNLIRSGMLATNVEIKFIVENCLKMSRLRAEHSPSCNGPPEISLKCWVKSGWQRIIR